MLITKGYRNHSCEDIDKQLSFRMLSDCMFLGFLSRAHKTALHSSPHWELYVKCGNRGLRIRNSQIKQIKLSETYLSTGQV